jgi:Leucine-rich repeat (LRR) protein
VDEDLTTLCSLGNLDTLILDETRVQGPGVANLRKLEKLRVLGLRYTPLGPKSGLFGIDSLRKLEKLDVGETPIVDEALKQVALNRNLVAVRLNKTKITGAGLAHFKDAPRLAVLVLDDTTKLERDHLACLSDLPALSHLSLARCRLGGPNLETLQKCQGLKTLNLDGNDLAPKKGEKKGKELGALPMPTGLEQLSLRDTKIKKRVRALAALTKLKRLRLSDNDLDGEDLAFLSSLPDLETLNLSQNNVRTKAVREHVLGLKKLRLLGLRGTVVNDEVVEPLLKLPNLEAVDLRDTEVTAAAIERLSHARESLKVCFTKPRD